MAFTFLYPTADWPEFIKDFSGIGLRAIILLIGRTVPGESTAVFPVSQAAQLQLACICMSALASPFSATLDISWSLPYIRTEVDCQI